MMVLLRQQFNKQTISFIVMIVVNDLVIVPNCSSARAMSLIRVGVFNEQMEVEQCVTGFKVCFLRVGMCVRVFVYVYVYVWVNKGDFSSLTHHQSSQFVIHKRALLFLYNLWILEIFKRASFIQQTEERYGMVLLFPSAK